MKADGLAAGKEVMVAMTIEEAKTARRYALVAIALERPVVP